MKHAVLVGTLIAALAIPAVRVSAQTKSAAGGGTSLGSVTLNRRVLVDGKPLPLGTYQVRLAGDAPKPGVGQSPDSERYVEFLRSGKVVAREVASVVTSSEIGQIAKGSRPAPGASKVELLKGNDYVRVWINRGGTHYLIHFPAAS